ncbi:MAG: BolA/IbaG family iron-sulfur metabolism protein [Alphaproteobacteria bacterium]|nr:BolA/IbaG family iron-sulfur metabolism protein [Alphaproteobacteria bacterium]
MAMSHDKIMTFLLETFPDAQIELKDLVGDSDHFSVTITSKVFSGKTRIEQHKMVYEALQGHMGTTLHALSLKTQIPKE